MTTAPKGKMISPMSDSPDHAAALGVMLANFAILESSLLRLMQLALNSTQGQAASIYNGIISVPAKLDIIQELLIHSKLPGELCEEITKLLTRARRLNKRRSEYVHASWGVGFKEGALTIISSGLSRGQEPKHRDIKASEIQRLADDLGELSWEISALLHPDKRAASYLG